MSEDSMNSDEGETPDEEELPDEEEMETNDEEELFPEDTPTTIKRRVTAYQNRLAEIGVQVRGISTQRERPDEDEEETENEEEPLESLALQCQFNRASFLVIFPVEEPFAIFQADYDVLEDMIYSADHELLGGDFEPLEPQARWEAHQKVRQTIAPEQVVGLCRANRAVPIPQLEAWFSFLRTASDKFAVETTRVNFEYIGAAATRRLYTSPNNLTTQELYDTVSQLMSLRQGIQDVLGSTYVLDGIQVPDNFATLHEEVEEDPRSDSHEPYNKGFQ